MLDQARIVCIIVVTMSNYIATVIKTGNSYALRVPKQYIDDAALTLGQKVQVSEPSLMPVVQDQAAIQRAIKNLQKVNAYADIKDPAAWQKEIRQDRPVPGRD